MDYEGATKVVNISESMKTLQSESNTSILEIKDHIYDVGQATISEITTEISTSDLFFIWGTSGVCEVGPFQNSMKNIVVSSSNRDWIPANTTAQSEVNKPHVLVLGDSTCEWFLR
jgi:3-phosphoglycerate kinase